MTLTRFLWMTLIQAFISLSHVELAFIVPSWMRNWIADFFPRPSYHSVPIFEAVVITPRMTDFLRRLRNLFPSTVISPGVSIQDFFDVRMVRVLHLVFLFCFFL